MKEHRHRSQKQKNALTHGKREQKVLVLVVLILLQNGKGITTVAADLERHSGAIRNLSRRMKEFVTEVGCSANIVVLKGPPGAAGPISTSLDAASLDGVLGTLGGDDTVLVVTRDANGGARVARQLEDIMEA